MFVAGSASVVGWTITSSVLLTAGRQTERPRQPVESINSEEKNNTHYTNPPPKIFFNNVDNPIFKQ
jgi:hypothetical protein